ncbi:UNVERIFIED_CONTAM: hypothetical protein PYX00_011262 [Menopon gallinae]|uniref:long-chain-fatty-acid--CoA ligase n=1 Tax=Menopon gallinae TaxID=328185 RepID=A0AAW2H711_9NEOP
MQPCMDAGLEMLLRELRGKRSRLAEERAARCGELRLFVKSNLGVFQRVLDAETRCLDESGARDDVAFVFGDRLQRAAQHCRERTRAAFRLSMVPAEEDVSPGRRRLGTRERGCARRLDSVLKMVYAIDALRRSASEGGAVRSEAHNLRLVVNIVSMTCRFLNGRDELCSLGPEDLAWPYSRSYADALGRDFHVPFDIEDMGEFVVGQKIRLLEQGIAGVTGLCAGDLETLLSYSFARDHGDDEILREGEAGGCGAEAQAFCAVLRGVLGDTRLCERRKALVFSYIVMRPFEGLRGTARGLCRAVSRMPPLGPLLQNSALNTMEFDGESYKHQKYMEGVTSLSDGSETLLELFINQCQVFPGGNAYGVIKDEEIVWISYRDALGEVLGLYSYFAEDIGKGSIVGIYSVNRYEWMVSEHAIYALGGVSCPLYSTYGVGALSHILKQTEMETCFMSGEKADSLYEDVLRYTRTHLRRAVVFDAFESEEKYRELGIDVVRFRDAARAAQPVDTLMARLMDDTRLPHVGDLATICYTSGTSGMPKGVMLTHKNFIASIAAFFRSTEGYRFYKVTHEDVYISYLPLAHVMERICVHTMLSKGAAIGFYRGVVKELARDYKIIRPTFVAGVPRVFNLFRDRILEQVARKGVLQQCMFYMALRWKYFLQRFGCCTSVLDHIVFNKVRREFGGRIRACLSGSAPMNKDVVRFLQAVLSCRIFQGYGQTETTAASIVSTMEENTVDTVGIPFPSNKIKLVSLGDEHDGQFEILVKGDNVFQGYFKNEVATRECFDEDGWLRTGDMGVVENGLFKIVGRKKETFKTSQGEYIVPEKIESMLQCPEVEDILVTGRSTKDFVVAVAVCTRDLDDAHVEDAVRALASRAVEKRAMMKFEAPRKIAVLRKPFSSLGEFLTPTGKKKRAHLERALKTHIDRLYGES